MKFKVGDKVVATKDLTYSGIKKDDVVTVLELDSKGEIRTVRWDSQECMQFMSGADRFKFKKEDTEMFTKKENEKRLQNELKCADLLDKIADLTKEFTDTYRELAKDVNDIKSASKLINVGAIVVKMYNPNGTKNVEAKVGHKMICNALMGELNECDDEINPFAAMLGRR